MKQTLSEIRPAIILAIIAIVLCLTGFFMYRSLTRIANDVSASANNDLRISQIKSVLSELTDAESGVRFYMLTQKEDYLLPFYYSVNEIEERTADLRKKNTRSAAQEIISDQLLRLISQRYELLEKEIQTDTSKTIDPKQKKLLQLHLMTDGKQLMDKIRYELMQMEANEKQAISDRVVYASGKLTLAKKLAAVFAIALSVMLFFISYTIINYIRKKKEYETALHLARQEALELAKTKEMFLASMSHEIKTPLNAIAGFTEQLQSSELNPAQKAQLDIVKRSADHLVRLVHNILTYSKMEAGKSSLDKSNFNLREVLLDIELLFKEQCKNKQIDFRVSIPSDLPALVYGDETKTKQVLFNIIGNAVKFTQNGKINTDVLFLKKENNIYWLDITIRDTGVGIPEAKIPLLFNEYQQINPVSSGNTSGTGLGLVITKKIIEQMDGVIQLTSLEKQGTQVHISIPVETVADGTEASKDATTADFLDNKKILIVDDEPFNKLLFKTILQKYNVQITDCENGAEAVEAVKTGAYDMVLMDVRMPVMNGIEACTAIRCLKGKGINELPILATTAVITKEKQEKCLKAGFNDFIYKPISEHAFITLLSKYMKPIDATLKKETRGDLLDIKVLDADTGGDETLKKELLFLFHKSINQGEADLSRFIGSGQWLEAAELAHKLMGSCRYFDARELYRILKIIENFRNQTPETNVAENTLNAYKTELKRVNGNLKLYL